MVNDVLKLLNPALKLDTISLLNNKKYWDILVSVYDYIDSNPQYVIYLHKHCEKNNLDFKTLARIANSFRYYLKLLTLKIITIDELKTSLKQIEHDDVDELCDFIDTTFKKYKSVFHKLNAVQKSFNQNKNHLLRNLDVKTCTTTIDVDGQDVPIPFILLRVDEKTYQCTAKDIEFIIDDLKKSIKKIGVSSE